MAWASLADAEIDALVALCEAHPDREIILPDEAYIRRSVGSPFVRIVVDGLRVPLHRVLYDRIHPDAPLGSAQLRHPAGQDTRNVNPLAMQVMRVGDRQSTTHCINGHEYAVVGVRPTGSYRCQACYEDQLAKRRNPDAGPDAAAINRAKTHCKRGHEFTPENTLHRPSDKGRRRCRTCEQERKQK